MSEQARYLTYMFCDLVGSTALTRELGDPEAAFELIHGFQRACAKEIEAHQGFVARYMGDSVLAYFGYPVALESSAEVAVRCALSMRDTVKDIDPRLELRAGIANGRGVLAELQMGGGNTEMAVVSDATNLAARLEARAEPGEILVSSQVREQASGMFEFSAARQVVLKGYEESETVFSVLGQGDYLSSSHQTDEQSEAGVALIGRDQQLLDVLALWREACEGQARAVLVHGEAGIGKTSFARMLRQKLDGDCRQIKLYTSRFENHTAFFPLITFFKGLWPSQEDKQLDGWLEQYVESESVEHFRSLIGWLLGYTLPPPILPNLLREKILQGLVDLFLQLAQKQPLLLVVEDIHWLDATTGELFNRLQAAAQSSRYCLLATSRVSADSLPALAWDQRIDLSRFANDDAHALLATIDVNQQLSETLRLRIVDKAGGVPLLLKEFARATLTALNEVTKRPADEVVIPDNLLQSFLAQIDPWSKVRNVIDVAAAIGHGFDAELIAHALGAETAEVAEALSQLAKNGLLVAYAAGSGQAFNFSHALLGDAAYSTLLRKQRRLLHEKVLSSWAELEPDYQQTQPRQAAHHLIGVGDYETAVTVLLTAAQARSAASQFAESVGLLEQALGLLPDISEEEVEEALALQLYTLQGLALTQARGFGDASVNEAYSRAWSISQSMRKTGKQAFDAVWGIWAHKLVVSDTVIGRELTHTLEEISAREGRSDLQMLSCTAGLVTRLCVGEFSRLEEDLSAVIEGYDLVQHARLALSYSMDPKALSLLFSSHAYAALGNVDRASWARAEAVNHVTGLGMEFLEPYANIFGIGSAIYYAADESTLAILDEYGQMAAELGLPFWLLSAALWKGSALCQMGDYAGAKVQLELSLQQADATGLSFTVPYHRSMYAQALTGLGELAEAASIFERSIADASATGERFVLPEIRRQYGCALLARGDQEAAETQFSEGLSLARSQSALGWEGRLLQSMRDHDMVALNGESLSDFTQRLRASAVVEQAWGQALLAEL